MFAEGPDDALRLFQAEQAVVDEDAGQLVTNSAMYQSGSDCGVDAAGERADHQAIAHTRLDRRD